MTTATMSERVEHIFRSNVREVLVDNMLTESSGLTSMQVLEEDSKSAGALIVEGKVGQCGVATANKRLYERRLMEREVSRIQDKISRRALLASVDHPTDGKSRIMDAGAICLGLRVEADGSVVGKYEIVEESDGGRNLAAFLRRGCQIGMSSRGVGSTRTDVSGQHVVGEDFKLHGFDFVADPACKDAFPTLVAEDIDPEAVTENELRVRFPSLVEDIEQRARQVGATVAESETRERVEQEFGAAIEETRAQIHEDIKLEVLAEVREQLREDFAAKLVKALQEQKSQVESVVRSELLSDPSVAGAKKFMEDLAAKLHPYRPAPDQKALFDNYTAEIETLKEQIEARDRSLQEHEAAMEQLAAQQVQAEQQARSLGFRLFVERAIAGFEQAEQMREMIGDPAHFESADDLRDRVQAVIRQVEESTASAEQRAQQAVKIKEHKAELAATKARLVSEELEEVKANFTTKLDDLTERFESQLQGRDSKIAERERQLTEALDAVDSLQARLDRAEQLAESAELAAYTERRTIGHPRRDDIVAAVRSGRISSQAEVQQLAEQWDVRGDAPGGVSERVRRTLGQGREAPTASDHGRMQQLQEGSQPLPGLENFGTTMGEIRALAGIGQNNNGRRRF